MNRHLAIFSWLFVLSLSAVAARGQFYLGLSAGEADYDQAGIDWTPSMLPLAFVLPPDASSETSKLYLGYRFNKHFAVEGGYTDLGQVIYTQRIDTLGRPSSLRSLDFLTFTEVTGSVLTAIGVLPFKIKKIELEAFVKAGAFYWTADSHASRTSRFRQRDSPVTVSTSVVEANDIASGFSPVFGFGLEIKTYRGLAFRAEVELFGDLGDGRLELDVADPVDPSSPLRLGMEAPAATLSFGLRYRFGEP